MNLFLLLQLMTILVISVLFDLISYKLIFE
jgi:hypothetical protein